MAMTAAGMLAKIHAAQADVDAQQTSDPETARTFASNMMLALCQGIIDEIAANAELVPVTTDIGAAGSGIITGKVK